MKYKKALLITVIGMFFSAILMFVASYYIITYVSAFQMRYAILSSVPFLVFLFFFAKTGIKIISNKASTVKNLNILLYLISAVVILFLVCFSVFPLTDFGYANNIWGVLLYRLIEQ